jgi:integrase
MRLLIDTAVQNPCNDIKKLTEKTRDRYIEDWEYKAVYDSAKPFIQITMEIAVITGLRQRDILDLRLSDLHNDGIHITTNKTKKINKWTPYLKSVINQAKALRKVTSSIYLICTQKGQQYTSSGFKSMWQKTMKKALADDVIKEKFTFRDLRPKAASDHEDGTMLLAHTDPKTTNKYYLRKPKKVTPSR